MTFYEWAGLHSLFSSPNLISGTFDVWVDVWAANGFQVSAVGSAIEAAGFTSSPATGQAAIVIGNSGRTVFNGFLFDDFESADKDADLDPDMIELIVNELASFCAGPSSCGDRIRDPGEDCDEGGVNAAAGEACDEGGIDTVACDSDCTLPVCGDGHWNVPAGEGCDDGGTTPGDGCSATCQVEACLVGSLTPLTLLKGVREGVGARFSWAPPTMPAVAHVNQVVARSAIPMAWRSPRGPGTPACDAVAGILECLDPTPPPDAPATGFLQVVAACGSSGLDEGPI